jgi:type I site-specific restriction endonuclease
VPPLYLQRVAAGARVFRRPSHRADGVNVDGWVYRIGTEVAERGGSVEASEWVDKPDRVTRDVRGEQLDEDLEYGANQLERDVVAPDQARTVIRTFRDRLPNDDEGKLIAFLFPMIYNAMCKTCNV